MQETGGPCGGRFSLTGLIPNDLEADPSRDLGGHVAMGSKAFFSEEKKQKTFANSGTCTTRTVRDSN
jgi:hypothetical protein